MKTRIPLILTLLLSLFGPAFAREAPGLPILDISDQKHRQVVIAEGTAEVYQGHPTTLLLPDGKTMFCVWTKGHGGSCGPMKRSDDGGKTWSELLPVPESWSKTRNCPALYRLTNPAGVSRIFVFAAQGPGGTMHSSHSLDEGRTWSAMKSVGLKCVMPFCTIIAVEGGEKLVGLTNIRRPGEAGSNILAQSESTDGGLTWGPFRIIADQSGLKLCEPEVIRSPDDRQLLCLIRENVRTEPAHFMTSDDEGNTWSGLRPLPPGLHGDRHKAAYTDDGRLVISFRDKGRDSPTKNHFVAWVGRYEDITGGRDGEYKIKLLHSHAGWDCGYPGVEKLPDGTIVATTYIKYAPGPKKHSVVSTRFKIAELDSLLTQRESSNPPRSAPRPNVLLVVSEDNGPELGCYGNRFARTPHLDRLAAGGLRFERAYVTQAGCSQSRSSILTGLYPHQNGQIALATHRFRMFSPDTPNLPATLGAAGYRTGVIGKIHVLPEEAFRFSYARNAGHNSFANRDVLAVAREAAAFLAECEGAPFFLMVNYSDAHVPWHRQQHGLPEAPLTAADVEPLPYVGLRTPEAMAGTANYYNCIARLDTGVGALLSELEKSGRTADTLVIYLGDHGAQMPRGKMTSYEGGVRIPLLVSWPGRIPAGGADRRLVSTTDLFPTVLEACRLPAMGSLPGRSLLPGSAQDSAATWREYLFTEFTAHWSETYFPSRTVRDDRFKLIMNLRPDRPNPLYQYYGRHYRFGQASLPPSFAAAYTTFARPPRFELYDLAADPHELRNLADDPAHAAELSRLHRVLADWQERTGDELRHPEKLARFTRDIEATFVNDKYQKPPPGFAWPYLRYLTPVDQ